jgi:hypothetical protein
MLGRRTHLCDRERRGRRHDEPTIVGDVLKKEMHLSEERIGQIIAENPTWTEDEVTWKLNEEMAAKGAELLRPVFERNDGMNGRISIQTNPKFYRDAARILEQGSTSSPLRRTSKSRCRPPVRASKRSRRRQLPESRSMPQCASASLTRLQLQRAVERGLDHAASGGDTTQLSPVCTMMVGRLDGWLGGARKARWHCPQSRVCPLGRCRLHEAGVRHPSGAGGTACVSSPLRTATGFIGPN